MSLSALREMNFTPLDEAEAAEVMGEGSASPAQCAEWLLLAGGEILGYSCGGSYQMWMNLYNSYCR
jgi:hypothetical protein